MSSSAQAAPTPPGKETCEQRLFAAILRREGFFVTIDRPDGKPITIRTTAPRALVLAAMSEACMIALRRRHLRFTDARRIIYQIAQAETTTTVMAAPSATTH